MLSPVENDLIHRDPDLPGLATALNPDAFAEALRGAAPGADLRKAQITYRRYKPHRFCRVAYRLDVAGTEMDLGVRVCLPKDLGMWTNESEAARMVGPFRPGRIVFQDRALLITVFPNDLKLAAVQYLADAAQRKRVLRELLPDFPNLWQAELHCLRYRPERRYVAELRAADGTRALLKAYTARAYSRGKHNAQAFASRGLLRVAKLLGSSDQHRLLAFEWLPGRLLLERCAGPEWDRAAVTATGAALAMLHEQDGAALCCWTREGEAKDLLSLAAEIGFICPQLARRATELARCLALKLSREPAVRCAVHGDFSANQVLVSDGSVAIVDLDWAGHGDPADDLGNFLAQAERNALRGELPRERVASLRAALLDGYSQGTHQPAPARVGLYTAVQVFRRMRFPFRAGEPDWPQRTEALLGRAEEILNGLRSSDLQFAS